MTIEVVEHVDEEDRERRLTDKIIDEFKRMSGPRIDEIAQELEDEGWEGNCTFDANTIVVSACLTLYEHYTRSITKQGGNVTTRHIDKKKAFES